MGSPAHIPELKFGHHQRQAVTVKVVFKVLCIVSCRYMVAAYGRPIPSGLQHAGLPRKCIWCYIAELHMLIEWQKDFKACS